MWECCIDHEPSGGPRSPVRTLPRRTGRPARGTSRQRRQRRVFLVRYDGVHGYVKELRWISLKGMNGKWKGKAKGQGKGSEQSGVSIRVQGSQLVSQQAVRCG